MPEMPLKPCKKPGCRYTTRVKNGYCPDHQSLAIDSRRLFDSRRDKTASRGYDGRWQRVRLVKLAEQPICEICGHPADTVHHIQPIETHPEFRLLIDNLMSLCRDCHEVVEGRLRKAIRNVL